MSLIKSGEIEKGMFLLFKSLPYVVIEREFSKTGRGGAFVRLKLKNLKTGAILRETLKGQETIEEAIIFDVKYQLLYKDENKLYFMDNETYEQIEFDYSNNLNIKDKLLFLKDGEVYNLIKWQDEFLDIKLAPKVAFKVISAETALRGNTVGNVLKNVTLDTGLIVKVPLFINIGDEILVNSQTKEYVERVNS